MAVQLVPIKPTLIAPGTKRLKPEYEGLLSNLGFKCSLRRYNAAPALEKLAEHVNSPR